MMKKSIIYTFLIVATALFANRSFAQAPPELINYQAIARVGNGVLASQTISVYFIIHDNTIAGNSLYEESQATNTNAYGLFTVQIGGGIVQSGSFSGIDWSTGKKYLEVKIDTAGGTNYQGLGTTQLISVPYALYAKNAASAATANTANTATTATTATSATTATTAVTATTALYADSSAHSGHSDTARVAMNVPLNPWANFALYQETRPANSSTQTSWTTNTWAPVYLNTNAVQLGSSISRNGNVITLTAGTYYIRSSVMVNMSTYNIVTTRLRDATTNTTVLNGNQCTVSASVSSGTAYALNSQTSFVEGIITVTSATENYQIEGWCYNATNVGASVATGPGEPGVFTSVFIQKIQ